MKSGKTKRKPRPKGGRPRKFREPSRPITVTLPLRTLGDLARINEDRAQAIVEVCDRMSNESGLQEPDVEVIRAGSGRGLIVLGPSRHLRDVPSLQLVDIGHGRQLISLKSGTPVSCVEVALGDLLESLPESDERERMMVAKLVSILRRTRQKKVMQTEEILIIPYDEEA
jgi:hypothetical protein